MRPVFLCLLLVLLAPVLEAQEPGFAPGEIVRVVRRGERVEARVVRQDASGVLVTYRDPRDGRFHDDGVREYKSAREVERTAGGETGTAGGGLGAEERRLRRSPPGTGDGFTPAPEPDGVLRVRRPRAAAPVATPAPAQAAPVETGGALPDGEYGCYTYHPNAVLVGVLTLSGSSYRTRTGASGRYRLAGDRVSWSGTAPMGFAVAVLEETSPAKLRMYPQASDIGNKWKAAVCTHRGAAAAATTGGGGSAAAAGFRAGERVLATFIGVDYGATVVRCESARCLIRYDDPSSKDEWVDTSRLKRR